MSIRLLEIFIRIADVGSFTKAAKDCNITVSALLKQINQLEAELGFSLFVRTNQGVILTEAGKSYYDDSKLIIQIANEAAVKANLVRQAHMDRVIRVGMSPMTPIDGFYEIYTAHKKELGDFKFNMVPVDNSMLSAEIILNNLGSTIDCSMDVFDEHLLKLYKCRAFPHSFIPLSCAVPRNNVLYSKEVIRLQDLKDQTLLCYKWGGLCYFDDLRKILTSLYPEIQIINYPNLNLTMFNEAENHNYIALSLGIWRNVHPFLKTIPIQHDIKVPYGLLYEEKPSAKMKEFLSVIGKRK